MSSTITGLLKFPGLAGFFGIRYIDLPAENGYPFQIIAEDKYGYKWVKWVTKIELSDNADYKGTWEKAGYNNAADVGGAKFE